MEEEEIDEAERRKWIRILITFYSIDFIICLMANLLHYFQGLNWLFIIEVVLALLTLIFVFIVRRDLKPLFNVKLRLQFVD